MIYYDEAGRIQYNLHDEDVELAKIMLMELMQKEMALKTAKIHVVKAFLKSGKSGNESFAIVNAAVSLMEQNTKGHTA